MDFSIKAFDTKNTIATAKAGVIAVAVFENKKLSQAAKALDGAGEITAALKSGDITGKTGTTLLLRGLKGAAAERVLLVGLGSDEAVSEKSFAGGVAAALKAFSSRHERRYYRIAADRSERARRQLGDPLRGAERPRVGIPHRWSKEQEGSGRHRREENRPGRAEHRRHQAGAGAGRRHRQRHGPDQGTGQHSANVCTPTHLANVAKKLGKDYKFDVEVLDRKQLEALKMNSFLSVTNGSEQPPKFIVMKHMGGKAKDAPVVLVGKGITFDTGGISLKPVLAWTR
jgi:leucyl aminopeptidase